MNKPNAPGEGSELPARPYLTEDGNGDKRHYPSDMTDALIEALEQRIAELQTKCAYQDAELKAALSSPQQESAEDAWSRGFYEALHAAENVPGAESKHHVLSQIRRFNLMPENPYAAPPVTAEGTNEV